MNLKLEQVLSPANCVSAREELNLSQAKVASDTGISRPYLSQFESGKRVLEDAKQQDLLDYFGGHGWQPVVPDKESDNVSELLPYIVRDGFIVPDSISAEDVESILEEYCDNAEKIERIRAVSVERGSWSGKIDTYHANENWLAAMMLAARQFTIIQLLHGKLEAGGEFVEQDRAAITTVGEYGDDMFYRGFVKGEGMDFRV